MAGRVDGGDAVAAGRLADFLERHGEGGLRFRHSLIRDVAYAGLPFRLRREAHERVGRALESRSAEPAAESELLSLHFFHAGVYDKAWTYSRIAGRRAHSRYAYVEAAELFERAVDAARQGDAAPADEIAAVLEQLGDVQTLAGAPREAMEAYRRARRLLGAAQVAAADLSYKEACLLQRLGKFPQSLRLLRTALRGLAELDAPAAAGVRCKLATRYGFGRYLQGRPAEAIHWCENGAAEGARGTDRSALAMAYNALHLAYLRSDREPDRPYAQLAMQIYEALDDLPGQGHAANTLAIAAHAAGRWDDAAQLFGRAAEVFRRIGDITNESNAVYNRADLLLRQGRFADAEPLLAEVLDTARAVDDEELVALALRERARACAGLRRFAEADELFADAGRRLSALGLRNELVTFEGARADAALRAGAADVALAAADRAIARARELGESDALAWLYRLRAGALIESGAPQAGAALAAGLAAPGTSDGGYERALLLRTEARLAARAGEPVPAAIEAEAAAILTGLGVVPAADPLTDAGAA
jgi:tetratricopeptide (TPR) repeat protein